MPSSVIMSSTHDAVNLLSELQGKILHIPSLKPTFENWPSTVNPHLDRLRQEINAALKRTISEEPRLQTLRSHDFGFLACCLYPQAEWEILRIAGLFILWIFTWDDEIDDSGALIAHDRVHAEAYCQSSLGYTRLYLGLGNADSSDEDYQNTPCPIPTMLYFQELCQDLRKNMNLGKRERLSQEIGDYMNWTANEQSVRESGKVLTPDQYIELRNWTSGIYPIIATFEFIAQVSFDESLIESDDMKTIWRETRFLCMLINDIHSAKKELASGSVLNAIPVFFHSEQAKDLSKTMTDIVAKLVLSIDSFDEAATKLTTQLTGDQLQPGMVRYLDTCRTAATGLLKWSLSTPRYGLSHYGDGEGGLRVTL